MSEYIVDLADNPSFGGVLVTCGEIVRCRDCKWFRQDMSDHEYRSGWWCDMGRFDPNPDGFCAWGERKVDE